MDEKLNWDDILGDIEERQAVLLLGHGFLPDAQKNLNEALGKALGEKLLYFYQRDGLFLFADNDAKTTAQKEAARYYKSCEPDEAILKKIVELPFRLVVSANPDTRLAEAFTRYRQPFQFDYYSSQTKEDSDALLARPTAERPLLYNLCGSHEDRKSLILDYDDLFRLLKNLLADNNVPVSELRMPLHSATTFIFFGFHFERWYTQLFLRYLNQNEFQFSNNARNYALKTTFTDADTQQFFIKQFNVRYIGGDTSFFEELHRRFSEKYPEKLRRLVDELSPTATTAVQLIEKNDIAAAISMIRIFGGQLDAGDLDLLSVTEANYNQYLQEKQEPTVSQEHLSTQLNRIRINLRQIAKKLQ